jgi:hypothetical protein
MGAFYTNFAVASTAQDKLSALLKKLGRNAYFSDTAGNFTFVYDEACEQNGDETEELAKKMSRELDSVVLAAMNHDDDILIYLLYEKGELIDSYNSCPKYFGDEVAGMDGDAAKLAAAFKVLANIDKIEQILSQTVYVFEAERHAALCKELGISDEYSLLSYEDITCGEYEEFIAEGSFTKV